MTTIDILLLEILSRSNEIKARDIYENLGHLEVSYCVANIYRRLHTLKSKNLVSIHWESGNKFYSISNLGKSHLSNFKAQLNKYESKSN